MSIRRTIPEGWRKTKGLPSCLDGARGARDRSGALQIIRRRLAGPVIGDDVVGHLLTSRRSFIPPLDGTDMHEDILAAVIRLEEAKTFRGGR